MAYKIIATNMFKKSCRILPDPYFSLKKKQEFQKKESSVTESQVSINGFNGRLDTLEERVGKLEMRSIKDIQAKA